MKKWLNEYLRFTRKERMGIFILLAIIIAFLWLPQYYRAKPDLVKIDTALLKLFQVPAMVNPKPMEAANSASMYNIHYFYFDPNTIGEKDWQALGLKEKTIQTLLNYRSKGGRFKVAEDLRKIWGLQKATADALIPYIRIPRTEAPALHSSNANRYIHTVPALQKTISPIDINTATAKDWEQLPGIGPVLAARIIKFREKLGGFADIDQVQKTYGIKDSVFQILRPFLRFSGTETAVKSEKLNLNLASAKAMKAVGVRSDIAEAIVNYRKEYGPFLELGDLKKIVFINETIFNEILPFFKL
ncbi:MAG: hypothetical protein EAZ13_02580 [Sphingobacteriia bacterium]|nr:MAG: hypothetical protein EAZ35_06735 [Sphingobacteriia bacterium]TAH08882.1 MAG: hypothetical protein EAZ13_02580 [Sphingobacteriia bacterium]